MADHDKALFQELANNYDAEERQAGVPPRGPEALSRTPTCHLTPACHPGTHNKACHRQEQAAFASRSYRDLQESWQWVYCYIELQDG